MRIIKMDNIEESTWAMNVYLLPLPYQVEEE